MEDGGCSIRQGGWWLRQVKGGRDGSVRVGWWLRQGVGSVYFRERVVLCQGEGGGGYDSKSWCYVRERVQATSGWGSGYIRESGVYVTERVVLHQGECGGCLKEGGVHGRERVVATFRTGWCSIFGFHFIPLNVYVY